MTSSLALHASQLRRTQGQHSLLAFMKLYLAEHLHHLPSAAHVEIYGLLEDVIRHRGRKLAIAAPRGFGKSTLVTLAYVLYGICYGQEQFIVLLSATASQAMQFLDNVKKELTENQKLLTDFPELAGPKPSPWTRAELETPTHVRLLALGTGQHIRGRKFGRFRPTLVIADDLENAENTFSLESREQLKDWFNHSILKVGGEGTNFLFLGTLHHPYCLLAEYVDANAHPEWIKRVYKAIMAWPQRADLWSQWSRIYNGQEAWDDTHGPQAAKAFYAANQTAIDEGVKLLWPERWSFYRLMEQYEDDPISFNSELQNEPINPHDCIFNVEEFTYWDEQFVSKDALLRALGEEVEFYGACDPSLGQDTMRGDYTAIVILARHRETKSTYVVEADLYRYTPTQTIEAIFAYYQRYRFERFAIETNQFQELLAQAVERRGRELGQYPPIERVKHTSESKVRRIQSLHPWLKNGAVQMCRKHTLLLDQCRFFPKGKHDDGPDALEMAVRAAEQGGCTPMLHVITLDDTERDEDDNARWINLG